MIKKLSIFTILFILCDQLLKQLVFHQIEVYQNIEVIKNFFSITHVHNTGAAFSIMSNNTFLLITIGLIAPILIYYLLIKDSILSKMDIIIYSLLIGGIIGNLLDRIMHGYVIDYLSLKIFNYNFPVFNLADIGIVVSVFLIVIKTIKEEVCKK